MSEEIELLIYNFKNSIQDRQMISYVDQIRLNLREKREEINGIFLLRKLSCNLKAFLLNI